jgi:hypothetical protein
VSDSPSSPELQHLARIFRHEIADLLQSLYSVTAILQVRLPASMSLEKQLLANLKTRAEDVRSHLDGLTQLASPGQAESREQNLGEALRVAVQRTQRLHPTLPITVEVSCQSVLADPVRLLATTSSLLAALADGATLLHVQNNTQGERAWARVHRLGNGATPQQMEWVQRPFPNAHFSPLALSLALLAQWLPLVGGELQVHNHEADMEVCFSLPIADSSDALK